VMKAAGSDPHVKGGTSAPGAVGQAGGVLLTETVTATALGRELSAGLAPWRKPLAVHDPVKVPADLAVTLAPGGDHRADVALLRGEPGVLGLVSCDATVSRTIAALAKNAPAAVRAINAARAAARKRAWAMAGVHAPDAGTDAKNPLIVELDATPVTSHSDQEHAAPTFKRGFAFHLLCSFTGHGPDGTGEPLAMLLRSGTATAADHRRRPHHLDQGVPGPAARPLAPPAGGPRRWTPTTPSATERGSPGSPTC